MSSNSRTTNKRTSSMDRGDKIVSIDSAPTSCVTEVGDKGGLPSKDCALRGERGGLVVFLPVEGGEIGDANDVACVNDCAI